MEEIYKDGSLKLYEAFPLEGKIDVKVGHIRTYLDKRVKQSNMVLLSNNLWDLVKVINDYTKYVNKEISSISSKEVHDIYIDEYDIGIGWKLSDTHVQTGEQSSKTCPQENHIYTIKEDFMSSRLYYWIMDTPKMTYRFMQFLKDR